MYTAVALLLGIIVCVHAAIDPNKTVHTWIANTFAGPTTSWSDAPWLWANYNISGFYVTPNGTVLLNTIWDEGGKEVGIYANGKVVAGVEYTHGWARSGGDAVTSDGKYIYFATSQGANEGFIGGWGVIQWPFPPINTTWYMVRRANMDGTPAYFYNSSSYMCISTNASLTVYGLAISAGILYVSRTSVIELYNASTGELKASWPATHAGQLALDKYDNLWVSPQFPGDVYMYSSNGAIKTTSIKVTGARGIAVHSVTNQLMVVGVVTNNVTAPNITIYNITSTGGTTKAATFGTNVWDYGGFYGDDRFENIVGVGSDSSGNICIAMALLGASIRCFSVLSFSSTPQLLWKLEGFEWVSTAHYDPIDDIIYGATHKYSFVPNSIGNGTEWSLYSSTLDILSYPWDPRGNWDVGAGSVRIYHFGGAKFMALEDMYASGVLVIRFVGELGIPCAAISKDGDPFDLPNVPTIAYGERYLWTDANGNSYPDADEFQVFKVKNTNSWGLEIDPNGTIWEVNREQGIEAFYYMGINEYGVPKYSYNASSYRFWPNPPTMIDCQRSYYDPSTDTMYLSGSTMANKYDTSVYWGEIGRGFQVYKNWTVNATILAFEFTLPNSSYPGLTEFPAYKAGYVQDEMLFASNGYQHNMDVYNVFTGELLASVYPLWYSGITDMCYAITVAKRSTGEYIVIVEEDAENKNMVYVIPSVVEPSTTASTTTHTTASTTAHTTSTTGATTEHTTTAPTTAPATASTTSSTATINSFHSTASVVIYCSGSIYLAAVLLLLLA